MPLNVELVMLEILFVPRLSNASDDAPVNAASARPVIEFEYRNLT